MTNEKSKMTRIERLDLIIVIFLGITAVATAWSTWQGGLHGSQMDQKYTISNNLASEGNSEYNAAVQWLMQDMLLYNELNGLMIDQVFADSKGDADETEKLEWKIEELITGNMGEEMYEAFEWAMAEAQRQGESVSPFDKEGFVESYFETALELLDESETLLEAGNLNNTHSDNQGLVTVLYAVVLFMLGTSASFKGIREKHILLALSGAFFLGATIYMFSIPIIMP